MKAIKTLSTAKEYGAPLGMDNCSSLFVQVEGQNQVSVWELTDADKEEVLRTGRVYLNVIGAGHPPVSVTSFNPLNPSLHEGAV